MSADADDKRAADERAVDEALVRRITDELMANPDVTGAIWIGSRERGEGIGPSSDIDICAIMRERAGPKWRRGFRDPETGRAIELLYRLPSLDRAKFQLSLRTGESWPHGYAHGRVLFDKDGTLAGLVEEARQAWQRGPDPLSESDRAWECFDLWQHRADIVDRVATQPEVSHHLLASLIPRLFMLAYRLHQRWIPPEKYLLDDLRQHDAELAAIFERCYRDGAKAAERLTAADDLFALLSVRHGIDFDASYRTAL
jgi:hypothetical protein